MILLFKIIYPIRKIRMNAEEDAIINVFDNNSNPYRRISRLNNLTLYKLEEDLIVL